MLIRTIIAISCVALAAACGQNASDETPAETPAATPAAAPATAEAATPAPAFARQPAPAGAMAYIIMPPDGAVVSSPVPIAFGLKGFGVAPAGVENANAGHHHLLIDTGLPDPNLPIPNDATHRHFGGGQTEAEIELEPGMHTLQLLLGDHLHVPHDPPIASAVVTIEVR